MNYISEVIDLFSSRCRKLTHLSPKDYALIAEWEKQEIPLFVVLNSINRIFDNLDQNNEFESIDVIEYFQNEVKKNFIDWLQNPKNVK